MSGGIPEDEMDTGEGKFEMFEYKNREKDPLDELRERYPKSKGVFSIGEEIEIKGSRFRVKDISPFGIKLKLLKAED